MIYLRHLLARGVKLAKSLTFWSIIIGLLLALDVNVITNFWRLWTQKGIAIALLSAEYKGSIILTSIIGMLLMFFYFVEKSENNEAQKDVNKLSGKLDDIATKMDTLITAVNGMSSTISNSVNQSRDKNSTSNTQSKR